MTSKVRMEMQLEAYEKVLWQARRHSKKSDAKLDARWFRARETASDGLSVGIWSLEFMFDFLLSSLLKIKKIQNEAKRCYHASQMTELKSSPR